MRSLLEVRGLEKRFPVRRGALQRVRGWIRAVDGVDLDLADGECLGLVGESGSGKTTLARCIMRLREPTSGEIRLLGKDLLALSGEALRRERRHFQMVFQDSHGSLNPRLRIGELLSEPLAALRIGPRRGRERRVAGLLELVGLPSEAAARYPHELSGGQRQRVGIARALAPEPRLVIADEPVSALDASVQAQIVNLLAELQDRMGLALIFIAHDLAVVEQIAHRVAVMYLGKIVEAARTGAIFAAPQHPYSASLLSAVPTADPRRRARRVVLPGEPSSPTTPPPGCSFHPRCPIARERCSRERPRLLEARSEHLTACHYPGELGRQEADRS
jgi:oligopeptide/dipeptide ABC transporter ATP-binding protein